MEPFWTNGNFNCTNPSRPKGKLGAFVWERREDSKAATEFFREKSDAMAAKFGIPPWLFAHSLLNPYAGAIMFGNMLTGTLSFGQGFGSVNNQDIPVLERGLMLGSDVLTVVAVAAPVAAEATIAMRGGAAEAQVIGAEARVLATESRAITNEMRVVTAEAKAGAGTTLAEGTAGSRIWHPLNGPGPLGDDMAATFRSSTYTELVTSEETVLYRVFGGNSREIGPFWTRTAPSGPLQSQIDSAILPEWGNTLEGVSTIRVPAGTTIYEGVAASQSQIVGGVNLIGGGSQVVVPKVDPSWIVK